MQKQKSRKTKLFTFLPYIAAALLVLEFDVRLLPGLFSLWFIANAVIATGVMKLLFPDLLDDYLSGQSKIRNVSNESYANTQINKFKSMHLAFFVIWFGLSYFKILTL